MNMKEIAAYCAANIEDWEPRVQIALGIIDHDRCPLSMADPGLYGQIQDCLDDLGIEDTDIDIEDIIFTDYESE